MERVELPMDYKPNQNEEYMNDSQLKYFKGKLLSWKQELLISSKETINNLKTETTLEPDLNDRASTESNIAFELRTRGRYKKLISKIEAALGRVESGEYGYCEVTGEEIGLNRLEARPIATMTIESQEKHESSERQYSED
jgi:DnaK suppressor protein